MSPHSAELQARLQEEAVYGRLPLLAGEREYSTRGILATGFAIAVAAWCFLIGGYAANVVGAVKGVVTLIAGCVIGVTASAASSALACNRYGLEQIDFTKSCFGQRGAKIILIFYIINQLGWTGYILVMFGHGVANVLGALAGSVAAAGGEWVVRGAVLAGLLLSYILVARGLHVINVFNSVVTPGLFLLTGLLFYVIFRDASWSELKALPPLQPAADRALGYVLALEYGLGAGFSWWPGIGFLSRNTDNQRNSLYPQILTLGLAIAKGPVVAIAVGRDPDTMPFRSAVLHFALVAVCRLAVPEPLQHARSLRRAAGAGAFPTDRLLALGSGIPDPATCRGVGDPGALWQWRSRCGSLRSALLRGRRQILCLDLRRSGRAEQNDHSPQAGRHAHAG